MSKKLRGALRTKHYQAAQNEQDASDLIKMLGEKRRDVMRIEAAMNDEIAQIKLAHEEQAAPIQAEIAEIIDSIQAWAEVNRDELTNDGKVKTVKLMSGEFNWRTRPPKVTLRGKPKIIQALKDLGLTRFIRTSEDIDKEALLKEKGAASSIAGITISSAGEDFNISPYEMQIENQQ